VFSYAQSLAHGHAGLTVGWGPGPGGMQEGRHHRGNILSSLHKEIGIGIEIGTPPDIGPLIVTQAFGRSTFARAFITGVAYQDTNENGQYDLGEGVGGIEVTVEDSRYHAITAEAGGYALPVFQDGSYDLTIRNTGSGDRIERVEIRGGHNVKLDFPLDQVPPLIRGPVKVEVGGAHHYAFSRMPGAVSYDLRRSELVPGDWVEGAEDHLSSQIKAKTSSSYPLRRAGIAASGSKSFHLTFTEWRDQSFEIDRTLRPTEHSELKFMTRFQWTSGSSTLYAQVSSDNGATWSSVWERTGNESRVDSKFILETVSLKRYRKQPLRLRFIFRHHNRAFLGSGAKFGVFIDDIQVTASDVVENSTVISLPGDVSQFWFEPSLESTFLLEMRANFPGSLPFGEALEVTSRKIPQLRVTSFGRMSEGRFRLTFSTSEPTGPFILERSNALQGPWVVDSEAKLIIEEGGLFRFDTMPAVPIGLGFYRVRLRSAGE